MAEQHGRTGTTVAAAGLTACVCLVATGCTGGAAAEDARPADPVRTLHRAADALVDAGTSKARTSMEMATGGTRVTIRGEGVYDYTRRRGRLKVLLPQDPAGQPEHRPITELLAPGALYMKNRGAGVPADKWVRVDTATLSDGNLVTGGATDPYAAAEVLRGTRRATYAGRTEVAAPRCTTTGAPPTWRRPPRPPPPGAGPRWRGGERVRHGRRPVRRVPRRRGPDPEDQAPLQLRQRTPAEHRGRRLHDPALRLRRPPPTSACRPPGTSTRAGSPRSDRRELARPCHARHGGHCLLWKAGDGREEVTHVAPVGGTAVQDHVALAEIELCGELIIAASAADEDRLSLESIDEVLRVAEERASAGG
ncbi:hypothetical protein GCM10020295_45200 [Streptomyces cinereospinus]